MNLKKRFNSCLSVKACQATKWASRTYGFRERTLRTNLTARARPSRARARASAGLFPVPSIWISTYVCMQARWQSPAERSDKREKAQWVSRHWLPTANDQSSSRVLSTAGHAGCCIMLWARAGVGQVPGAGTIKTYRQKCRHNSRQVNLTIGIGPMDDYKIEFP